MDAVIDWSGVLLPAETELTDAEITERYGRLIESAVFAFRDDPGYVVSIAEAAARTKKRRRKSWGVLIPAS